MPKDEEFERLQKIYRTDDGDYTDESIIYENAKMYIEYVLEEVNIGTGMMRKMFHDCIERRLIKMIKEKLNNNKHHFNHKNQRELKKILGSLDEPEVINLYIERYTELFDKYKYLLHPDRNKPIEQIIEEGAEKLTKYLIKKFVDVYDKK